MKASKAKASKVLRSTHTSKKGVLVLGMHRSGTSAITRVLNLLGCSLPEKLIGPGDGNVLGHWEAFDAVDLNDQILASAGSTWEDWGPLNDDWRRSGVRSEMLGRVSDLVRQHAELGPLFALKDPRLCRLADLWLEGMDAAEVEPLVILMLRNPLEVVRSLESRDLMNPGYGQLLWLRHVLDAELASRGRKRVVCRYDQMMRNWPGMIARIKSALDLALPRNSPAARAEVDAFLTAEQRHQALDLEAALDDPWLTGWARGVLAILVRWSEQGEDEADLAELDRIRLEFNNAYGALAGLFVNAEAAGSVGSGSRLKAQLDEQLGLAQHAADEAQARVAQAEADRAVALALQAEQAAQVEASHAHAAALEEQLAGLRAEIERLGHDTAAAAMLGQKVAELTAEAEARQARISELEAGLQALELTLKASGEREEQLGQSASQLQSALDAAHRDATAVTAQLLQTEEKLEAATRDLHDHALQNAELSGRLSLAESTLVQRQEELTQLWEQLLRSGQAASAAQAEAELERQRRIDTDARAKELEAELGDLRAMLEAVEDRAEREQAQRSEEIAKLTLMLQEQEAAAKAADDVRRAAEQDLAKVAAEAAALRVQLEQQEKAAEAAESARTGAEQKLAARFDEIAQLTRLLVEEGDRVSKAAGDAEWLRSANQVAEGFPRWWAAMPKSWRRRREHARYRRAGLFDAAVYLERYPDVVEDGMDPVRHYILHGMPEGRAREG